MSSTTFVDGQTVIFASWLNDVNEFVYGEGFTSSPTAVPTSVISKLKETVTFDDYLTDEERAAAKSGDVVDMTINMNKALAAAKEVRAVSGRLYRFTTLEIPNDNTTLFIENGATLAPSSATITGINVSGDDCAICGEGVILSPPSWDGTNARRTYGTVWVTGNGFQFKDATLYNIPRSGIHFEDSTNGRIENAKLIGNYPYASYTLLTTGHCAIDYNPPTTAGPTSATGNGSLIVTGSRIESSIQGVFFGNFDSPASEIGVTIVGNSFNRCWDHGIYTTLAKGTTVTGNNFVNCKNPIVVDGGGCVVSGNTLYATETTQSNGQQVISVRDTTDAVVSGNTLIGLGAGIDVAAIGGTTVRRTKVIGNTIRSTGVGLAKSYIRLGFGCEVCEDNEISHNTMSGGFIDANVGAIQLETKSSSFVANGTQIVGNTIIVEGTLVGETAAIQAIDHDNLTVCGNRIKCTATSASATAVRQIFLTRCGDYNIDDNRLEYSSGGTNVTLRGIQTDEIGIVRRNIFRNTSGSLTSTDNTGFVAAGSYVSGNRFSTGAISGVATLVAGTVTVNTTEVRTGDRIRLTRQSFGGTSGDLALGTITSGTSFVINSTSGTDTGTVFWEIEH